MKSNTKAAQLERIAYLMEECAEVIQICGKIIRHGPESSNPNDLESRSNMDLLAEELADVRKAEHLLISAEDVDPDAIAHHYGKPRSRYFHHQQDLA